VLLHVMLMLCCIVAWSWLSWEVRGVGWRNGWVQLRKHLSFSSESFRDGWAASSRRCSWENVTWWSYINSISCSISSTCIYSSRLPHRR